MNPAQMIPTSFNIDLPLSGARSIMESMLPHHRDMGQVGFGIVIFDLYKVRVAGQPDKMAVSFFPRIRVCRCREPFF